MEDYFKDAIVYYYKYLIKEGYSDPVRIIISNFLEAVKITKEQEEYIKDKTNVDIKTINNLLILIKKMKADNKIDIQSLDLIESYLMKL